jgi:hypothetical protein
MDVVQARDSSTGFTSSDAYVMKRHAGRLPSGAVERLRGPAPEDPSADPWDGLTDRITAEAMSGNPGCFDGADVQLVEDEVLRLKRFAADRVHDAGSAEQSRAAGKVLRERARDLVAVADRLRPRVPRPALDTSRSRSTP